MIKTLGKEPVVFTFKEDVDENPTKFWIKPMTYGDYQQDIRLVKVKTTDGIIDVVNAEEVEKNFFKKYIVKIENIEHNGETIDVVEDSNKILEIIQALDNVHGNLLKTAIEEFSKLSEIEAKN